MQLLVASNGDIRGLYDDALPWHELGRPSIRRASFVEPDADGFWFADLSPVGGPALGPFAARRAALQAETAWLLSHWLPRS